MYNPNLYHIAIHEDTHAARKYIRAVDNQQCQSAIDRAALAFLIEQERSNNIDRDDFSLYIDLPDQSTPVNPHVSTATD